MPTAGLRDTLHDHIDADLVGVFSLPICPVVEHVEVMPYSPRSGNRNTGQILSVDRDSGPRVGHVRGATLLEIRRRPICHSRSACSALVLPASFGPTNTTGLPSSMSASTKRLKRRITRRVSMARKPTTYDVWPSPQCMHAQRGGAHRRAARANDPGQAELRGDPRPLSRESPLESGCNLASASGGAAGRSARRRAGRRRRSLRHLVSAP